MTGGRQARRSASSAPSAPSTPFRARPVDDPVEQDTGPAPTMGFDVLGFLAEHAPLTEWQRDILRVVRAEAYYFMPQRMTKIMNEGWASFWHSRMLTGRILDASEIVDFADCHSSATATAPGRLNPYKLGIELFRYAEETGRDLMRLRRIHNDASFVDELVDDARRLAEILGGQHLLEHSQTEHGVQAAEPTPGVVPHGRRDDLDRSAPEVEGPTDVCGVELREGGEHVPAHRGLLATPQANLVRVVEHEQCGVLGKAVEHVADVLLDLGLGPRAATASEPPGPPVRPEPRTCGLPWGRLSQV